MSRLVVFIFGIALLLVGGAKVWTHTQSLQAFLSVRCGPEGLSSAANLPTFWTSLLGGHCWGCPVLIAGIALILVAGRMQLTPFSVSGPRTR
jgi:hypothetical protein